MWLDGVAYPMTVAELRLLEVLASTPGRVWSRQALLAEAWPEGDVQLRTIDVHVRRLREKLGPHSDLIETVRGVGYRVGGPYTV
jgi:DNA-binding response OmpR family regulator